MGRTGQDIAQIMIAETAITGPKFPNAGFSRADRSDYVHDQFYGIIPPSVGPILGLSISGHVRQLFSRISSLETHGNDGLTAALHAAV